MTSTLLSLVLLLQGIPALSQQNGTVTGVLLNAEGKPLPGTRVTAVAQSQDVATLNEVEVFAALAETDEQGRYRLENVPPGRYYIKAGNVNTPTFFPGTLEVREGTVVTVTAGATVSGLNFKLSPASVGRASVGNLFQIGGVGGTPVLTIPIDARVEGGGAIPVFGPTGFASISFAPPAGAQFFVDISTPVVRLAGTSADYKVTVENLAEGYTVKSLSYDGTDLRTNNLTLSSAKFTAAATASPLSGSFSVFATSNGGGLSAQNQSVLVIVNSQQTLLPLPPGPQGPALSLVLAKTPPATSTGVRVTGKAVGTENRSIYISGVPGILFADGTFEFRGVRPGRHVIATVKNTSGHPLGATVIVGTSDLDGVQLEPTRLLPVGIQTPAPPEPPGPYPVGAKIPLVMLTGKVIDKETKQPASPGMVFVTGGYSGTSHDLAEDGTFQFGPLLPGRYNLEIIYFAHQTEKRAVIVGDGGANLEIEAVRKPE
jgi:hypothetical protein